jgi:hypothetical protein
MEHVEIDFYPRCDDDTLPPNAAIFHWARLLIDATDTACKPLAYNPDIRNQLQRTGFVDINEQVIRVPMNPWPTDPHQREIGRWYNLGLCQNLEAMSLGPLTRIQNWSKEDVEKLIADVKREICSRKFQVYCNMHIWTARRPA